MAIDWDGFFADLKKTFGDGDTQEKVEWKIESYKQGKQNTMEFMVMFEALKRQSKISDEHARFLLKRNTRPDIIHTIMAYPPQALPTSYDEWIEAITSVGRGRDAIDYPRGDYRTGTGMVYGGRGQPMEIGRNLPKYKDGKPKCFNCNTYGHMAKDCRKPKKSGCFRCGKEGHIAKDCRGTPIIKK